MSQAISNSADNPAEKLPFPLDTRDFANDQLLANLQGNIIKGHGRG